MELRRLDKFRRLPRPDKFLLLEAALLLSFARAVIEFVPIRWYAPYLLGRHMAETPCGAMDDHHKELLRRVAWAVQVMSDFAPWRNKCFAAAVAAKWMLRRRGLAGTLYLGARGEGENGLAAHAWLRCGDVYVTGGKGGEFGTVSRFG